MGIVIIKSETDPKADVHWNKAVVGLSLLAKTFGPRPSIEKWIAFKETVEPEILAAWDIYWRHAVDKTWGRYDAHNFENSIQQFLFKQWDLLDPEHRFRNMDSK
jgi:hypothetical protein